MKKDWVKVGILLFIALLVSVPMLPSAVVSSAVVFTIGPSTAHASTTVDYECNGVNDHITVQTALDALPAGGGSLNFLTGTYTFAGTVTRSIDNVTIAGLGDATLFNYNNSNPLFTAGGNYWVFKDFKTDSGGINVGATVGWSMMNIVQGSVRTSMQVPGNVTTTGTFTAAHALGLPNGTSPSSLEGYIYWNSSTDTLYVGDGSSPVEIGSGGGGTVTALAHLSDVGTATPNSGNIFVADGGDFNAVPISGDLSVDSDGTATVTPYIGATAYVIAADAAAGWPHTSGTMVFECDGNADEETFNEASDVLESLGGGKIEASDGEFTVSAGKTILVPSNTTLQGQGYATLIKSANTSVFTTLISNSDTVSGNTNVTVRDLRVDGNDANATQVTQGVILRNVTNGSVQNVWASEMSRTGVSGSNRGIGIGIAESSGILVNGCHTHDNGHANIRIMNSSSSITVTNNFSWNGDAEGICVGNETPAGGGTSSGEECTDILIEGNSVWNNSTVESVANIAIEDASASSTANNPHMRVSIKNNNVSGGYKGISAHMADEAGINQGDHTISGNIVDSTSNVGIYLKSFSFSTIVGNTITNSTPTAISCTDVSDIKVTLNTLTGGNRAIDGNGVARGEFTFNTAANNDNHGFDFFGACPDNSLSFNTISAPEDYYCIRFMGTSPRPIMIGNHLYLETVVTDDNDSGACIFISDSESDATVQNNVFVSRSTDTGSCWFKGIETDGDSGYFTGNKTVTEGTNDFYYAVDVNASADSTVIQFNDFRICNTDINDGGTNTVDANNNGDVNEVSIGATAYVVASDAAGGWPGTSGTMVFECDGSADEIVANAALLAGSGGKVVFSDGSFSIIGGLVVPSSTIVEGQGAGTVINRASSISGETLSGALNDSSTSVTVSDGNAFIAGQTIRVDSEDMYISSISGNVLTVIREYNGTTAVSHSDATSVTFRMEAIRNAATDEGTSSNIIIRNLTVDANNGSIASDVAGGIILRNCDNSIIEGCWIQNTEGNHPTGPDMDFLRGSGIGIDGSSNVTVRENYITDTSHGGIGLRNDCHHLTIENNYVWNSEYEGIVVGNKTFGASSATGEGCTDIVISNNHLWDNGLTASSADINIEDQATSGIGNPHLRVKVIGNTIRRVSSGSTTGILALRQSGTTRTSVYCNILGNTVNGTAHTGIRVEYCDSVMIARNVVDNTTGVGLSLSNADYNSIVGNISTNGGAEGVNISAAVSCLISENQISGNAADGIEVNASSTDAMIKGNSISVLDNCRGILVQGVTTDRPVIQNNRIVTTGTSGGGSGIFLASGSGADDAFISGNNVVNTNAAGTPTTKGIDCYTDRAFITQNKIYNESESNGYYNSIKIESAADACIIKDNNFIGGYSNAALNIVGTNTVIYDNEGWDENIYSGTHDFTDATLVGVATSISKPLIVSADVAGSNGFPSTSNTSNGLLVCDGIADEVQFEYFDNNLPIRTLVEVTSGSFNFSTDWENDRCHFIGQGSAIVEGEFTVWDADPTISFGPEFYAITQIRTSSSDVGVKVNQFGNLSKMDIHIPGTIDDHTDPLLTIGGDDEEWLLHSTDGPISDISVTCDERMLTGGAADSRVGTGIYFDMEDTSGTKSVSIQDCYMPNVMAYGFETGVSIYSGTNSYFNANHCPDWQITRCNTGILLDAKGGGSSDGNIMFNQWFGLNLKEGGSTNWIGIKITGEDVESNEFEYLTFDMDSDDIAVDFSDAVNGATNRFIDKGNRPQATIFHPALSASLQSSGVIKWVQLDTFSATYTFGDVLTGWSNGRWRHADADASNTTFGEIAMMVNTVTLNENDWCPVLFEGYARHTSFHSITDIAMGAPLYVNTTAGPPAANAPTGSNDSVRAIGTYAAYDVIYFRPEAGDYVQYTCGGTATITDGNASVTITHPLSLTPTACFAMPTETASGTLYVPTVTVTDTDFVVTSNTTTGNRTIYWIVVK